MLKNTLALFFLSLVLCCKPSQQFSNPYSKYLQMESVNNYFVHSAFNDYEKSLIMHDRSRHIQPEVCPEGITDFRLENASTVILREAADREVIFLTNNAAYPFLNNFAADLLDSLYLLGYRNIGLIKEKTKVGLVKEISSLNINSCVDCVNPTMGHLFRKCEKLGVSVSFLSSGVKIKLVGADTLEAGKVEKLYQSDDGEFFQKLTIENGNVKLEQNFNKEKLLAQHLVDLMAEREGKWLLLLGEIHVRKNDPKSMLSHYSAITGDQNPLSIDQAIMNEHASEALEHCYYRAVKESLEKPSIVYLDAAPLKSFYNDDRNVDYQIFHPPTTYINNRPHWRLKEGYSFRPALTNDDSDVPIWYVFFSKKEWESLKMDAIPLDIFYLKKGAALAPILPDEEVVLVVCKGDNCKEVKGTSK